MKILPLLPKIPMHTRWWKQACRNSIALAPPADKTHNLI